VANPWNKETGSDKERIVSWKRELLQTCLPGFPAEAAQCLRCPRTHASPENSAAFQRYWHRLWGLSSRFLVSENPSQATHTPGHIPSSPFKYSAFLIKLVFA